MSELDAIGTLCGTDKSSTLSFAWDYLRHYEELFSRWKHSEINLIEIGVAGGASLATWRRFFEKATLVGIDVDPNCRRLAGDRVVIKTGSQEDPSFLQTVAAEYKPTIVIDDGSHLAHHMITAFETLFPQLRPGGVYVFEDLAFHFEDGGGQLQGFKKHQGLSDTPIYDYLSRFIRARAANAAQPKDAWGFARYAFEQIDSVMTFGGAIAVRKRAPRDFEEDMEIFERELKQAPNKSLAEHRYAHYLVRHKVHQDRAVALLREVLKTNPGNWSALVDLFRLLDRLQRFDEAAETAETLTRLDPTNGAAWGMRVETERKRKRPDLELPALQSLAKIHPDSRDIHSRLSTLYEHEGDMRNALIAARKASDIDPANIGLANRVRDLEPDANLKPKDRAIA